MTKPRKPAKNTTEIAEGDLVRLAPMTEREWRREIIWGGRKEDFIHKDITLQDRENLVNFIFFQESGYLRVNSVFKGPKETIVSLGKSRSVLQFLDISAKYLSKNPAPLKGPPFPVGEMLKEWREFFGITEEKAVEIKPPTEKERVPRKGKKVEVAEEETSYKVGTAFWFTKPEKSTQQYMEDYRVWTGALANEEDLQDFRNFFEGKAPLYVKENRKPSSPIVHLGTFHDESDVSICILKILVRNESISGVESNKVPKKESLKSEKPLKLLSNFHWDLVTAVSFVREIQEVVHPLGYNALLGGSVLNIGYSENDLDVVLIPRRNKFPLKTSPQEMGIALASHIKEGKTFSDRTSWKMKHKNRRVDLTIFKGPKFSTKFPKE